MGSQGSRYRERRVAAGRPLPPLEWDPVTLQLKGFARGLAEIQWLLVCLVLLYLVLAADGESLPLMPLAVTAGYFLFSLGSNYLTLLGQPYRWALAVQNWVMIGFITWLIYVTGEVDGPLVNLYVLAVITVALTLGKLITLLEIAAIAACYLLLVYHLHGMQGLVDESLVIVVANVLMFILVGYLTTVLADAIYFANDRMRRLASTDELTGLYNRAAFGGFANSLLATANRYNRPLSVLLIDIDNLKQFNDRYGHHHGDQAIAVVGRRLGHVVRDSDVAARYAGDEFVAVLPETHAEGAMELGRRLLQQAASEPLLQQQLTMSIGVAVFPEHGDDVDALIQRADRAMYDSKRRGGNTVSLYDPEQQSMAKRARRGAEQDG